MANDRIDQSEQPRRTSPPPPTAPMTTEQQLAMALTALAESQTKMAALMEQQGVYNRQALKIAPRRRKSMQEYLHQKPRKHLKHEVYQNSHLVNPKGLSQETLNVLDTLDSGTYCDGLVQVVRITDGVGGINSRIHIRYNNKSLEQRMMLYMRFPTFTKMVLDIAADMKALGRAPVNEVFNDPPSYEFSDELSEL